MLESVPFIHTFRTSGGDYIYDVNKNTIVKTQKSVYEFLNNLSKDNIKQSLESNTKEVFGAIENLVTEGFLSSNKLSEIVHPMDEFLVDCLNNKVRMITLQVTQQCNLRCSYCVYSDNYQTREHSNRRMDFEIARKGIDFIISHSKDLSHINIGFYGGEPILEFEMIKRCISYAEEKAEGKFVTFNMTTNGTLINEEVIEYFQEHNVSILISLDGPKSIHDKNRVFASNGQGSFDRIIANIENIREKYPEYSKNITFNIVLDPENNFSCINQFFMGFETIKDLNVNTTYLSNTYLKDDLQKHNLSDDFISEGYYEMFKLLLSKLNRLGEGSISPLILYEYEKIRKLYSIELKPTDNLPSRSHPGGPCVPGVQRMFIDVNGRFFPCERVSEESEMMSIGDLDKGFDIEKIRKILNIGKLTEENCKNCWAFRFCTVCAALADNLTSFSKEKKLSHCSLVKAEIEERFKIYCTLKEFGHKFEVEKKLVVC